MAGKKFIRWLYEELPKLVEQGVLGESQADALRAHYGSIQKVGGRKVALVIFSVIGSLLIGAGVISLLAHNWSELTRPARTFLALAPLLAAQAYGINVLRTKQGLGPREGAATLISLLFVSAVAIVGQTYHIGGDAGSLLLTCSIFILPLAFILDTVMPAVLYTGAITGWLGYQRVHDDGIYLFWILLIPVLFKYVKMVRADRYAGRTVLLSWVLAICMPIATGFIQEYTMDGAWVVIFSSVFGVMYLSAKKWFADAENVWTSPFKAIGGAGLIVMSFLLTYEFLWEEAMYSNRWHDFCCADVLMMLIPVTGVVVLGIPLVRSKRYLEMATGGMPLLAAFTYVFVNGSNFEGIGVVSFNVYVLALSVGRIVAGLKRESVAALNSGMLMLGLLIILRFIDAELGFLAKGIVFILLGSGFLAVNVIMLRKKKEVSE